MRAIDVELFGRTLTHIVDVVDHGFSMLTEDFAKRLTASGMTGFAVRNAVKISANQSGAADPKLLLFEVKGKGGFGHRYKVRGGPNLCPKCKHSPVICAYCGRISSKCSVCGFDLIRTGPNGDPDSIVLEAAPTKLIVANRDWDGSDIFGVDGPGGGVFFSRRAKEWFEELHIFEVNFKPALIDMVG